RKHGGISAASNHALALARGQWITFLDHDDLLGPDALFHVAALLQKNPDADLIYSDEDKLGEHGFEAPVFKPDWSPDLFLSCNYVGHLTAVRRDVLEKAGRFRPQFDSAQDYDLLFRVISERTGFIIFRGCCITGDAVKRRARVVFARNRGSSTPHDWLLKTTLI